ncbi:MAG: hypothetical protein WJ306_12360 [Ferrovum myxofaciens]
MSMALQRHWLQDEASPDLEEGLATIRAARSQVEAETHAFLEEQAKLRAEAVLRAVPVDQLVQSRNEDLKRLEGGTTAGRTTGHRSHRRTNGNCSACHRGR